MQEHGTNEAERKAEEEIHGFNRQSNTAQSMVTSDAAQTLEVKLAQIASDLTIARAKKREAENMINEAKQNQKNAETVRKDQIAQGKAEAERTVQLSEQQHAETKQRDQKEVKELLERAQRSEDQVGSRGDAVDPEEKAAAAAKLQAFAESAAKLANADNEEIKAEKEQGEVTSERATEGERQAEQEAARQEEITKAEAQRTIEGD